jgi:hypothetical protein
MVVGLMLGTLLGFSALAVDIGMIRVAATQLQVSLDAAALSGATEFDGSSGGIENAKARAIEIAGLNPVLSTTLLVVDSDITIGVVGEDGAWTLWDGVDPDEVNAIRVAHTPPQLASALGSVAFGIASYALSARAMAVRAHDNDKAISTECFLPLAVPDCKVASTPVGENPPPFKFTFSPTPSDSIAWASPSDVSSTSKPYLEGQLRGACDSYEIRVEDEINTNQGVVADALHTVKAILNEADSLATPTSWDSDLYGDIPPRDGGDYTANVAWPAGSDVKTLNWENVIEGPIALVDAGTDCTAVDFTDSMEVTGIGWAVIYDVKDSGTGGKNIYVQLDLINEHEVWGDVGEGTGPNVFGPQPPTLVSW